MARLICFLIGHRVDVECWSRIAGTVARWQRAVTCSRCGELLHRQYLSSKTKPLDVWEH
jgi:hypothetical protein